MRVKFLVLTVCVFVMWGLVILHVGGGRVRGPVNRVHVTKSARLRPVSNVSRLSTAPRRWKPGSDVRYDAVARIMRAFDDRDVDTFLVAGSALGAHRNHGWFHWDKDADLMIMSTDGHMVEDLLRSLNMSYRENTNGVGPGRHGFGYHIYLHGTKKYIDLWLFEDRNELVCVGVEGGCKRWCNKYGAPMCRPHAKHWFYPPQFVPYGPYLMACGRESYVEYYYSKTWRTACGGWTRGKQDCSQYYSSTDFVFRDVDDQGHAVEILKQGSTVKHVFTVINGTYALKTLL